MSLAALDPRVVPPEAAAVLEPYLGALARWLPAARHTKQGILAEIADGLTCCLQHRIASGAAPVDAARAAVAEFGDPRRLAGEFAAQLVPTTAHRTGLALVVTGPFVGLVWAAGYAGTTPSWLDRLETVLSSVSAYPLILVMTVPAAVVAIGGAGRLARELRLPARWPGVAALIAAAGCILGDAALVTSTVAAGRLGAASTGLFAAIAVSVARASAAGLAMRRIARLRAAAH